MKKYGFFAILGLCLTACSSKPNNPLPQVEQPIINVEQALSQDIEIRAKQREVMLTNLLDESVRVEYKLFWYDKNGVSQQLSGGSQAWYALKLSPRQAVSVQLSKPTEESENYRLYLRKAR